MKSTNEPADIDVLMLEELKKTNELLAKLHNEHKKMRIRFEQIKVELE